MPDSLAAAEAWLEASQGEMIESLIRIASINSGSDNLNGLLQMASQLEQLFEPLGVSPIRFSLADRSSIDDLARSTQLTSAPALIWHRRETSSQRILLAIHYDTVYSPQNSFQTCRWLDDRRLNGPGVADAKGGIIVLLFALMAFERFFQPQRLGWTVVLNPDEEIGSPASAELWRQIAGQFQSGWLFEPSLPDGSLVSQRKGSGNFCIVVRGRAAHAGRHFEEGRNAVVTAAKIAVDLANLSHQRPDLTVNVGKIVGGEALNIVPDLALVRFNVRLATFEDQSWVHQQISQMITRYNSHEGFSCEVHGGITSPPKMADAAQRRLQTMVENSRIRLGLPAPRWITTGGVCDGNKLSAAGLPNIDTLGPCGDRLHSPEEWVDITSLVPAAKTMLGILSACNHNATP